MYSGSNPAVDHLVTLIQAQNWTAIASLIEHADIRTDSPLGMALLRACPYLKHLDETTETLTQFYRALQYGTISSDVQQLALKHMYPCACCGYLVFNTPAGSYDICNICFWEDDAYQLRFPDKPGANLALREEQRCFQDPARRESLIAEHHCITPHAGVIKDPHWMTLDDFALKHPQKNLAEISDTPTPYYWRQT